MSRRSTDMETDMAVSPLLQQVLDYRQAIEREAETFHPDARALYPFMVAVTRLAARADSGEGRHG